MGMYFNAVVVEVKTFILFSAFLKFVFCKIGCSLELNEIMIGNREKIQLSSLSRKSCTMVVRYVSINCTNLNFLIGILTRIMLCLMHYFKIHIISKPSGFSG